HPLPASAAGKFRTYERVVCGASGGPGRLAPTMKRTGLGRILWWAAPILLAVGIASRAADLREIAASLVGVKPGWVAAALVLGVLFTLNQGALYRAIFRLFDVRISLRESVRLALVMAFGSLAAGGALLWCLAAGRAFGTASRLASSINVLIARLHRRPVDRRRAAAWVADLRQIAIHLRRNRGRVPALFLYGVAVQLTSLATFA